MCTSLGTRCFSRGKVYHDQARAEEENKEAGLEAAVPGGKKRKTKWLTVGLEV
jgi:hypothetical protein